MPTHEPRGSTEYTEVDSTELYRSIRIYYKQKINLSSFYKLKIKESGFTTTADEIRRVNRKQSQMSTVLGGVIEELPTGQYEAALNTDMGQLYISGRRRSGDSQAVENTPPSYQEQHDQFLSNAELIARLASNGTKCSPQIIAEIELATFSDAETQELLPLLWSYISCTPQFVHKERLIAAGSAIRKYLANVAIEKLDELVAIMQPNSQTCLSLEIEIEVAKMLGRIFEHTPPAELDSLPGMATCLFEMAKGYSHPRILLREKFSAAACTAIYALASMRSRLAGEAIAISKSSPYRWFEEYVHDSMDRLLGFWRPNHPDATLWLEHCIQNASKRPLNS